MEIMIWSTVFLTSLFVLLRAADYFTEYAEKLGLLLKLSPFIVGVLIVAFGTSIPEFANGIIVALRGGAETAFVIENVVGSNIANIFLVVGLGAVFGGAVFVKRNLIHIDLPVLALTTTLFAVLVLFDGKIVFYEAALLVSAFGVYLWYVLTHPEETEGPQLKAEPFSWKIPLVLIGSVAAIYYSARWTVDSILTIADLLNITSSVLVMSVVAIGTSLPEIFVTIAAVRRKNYEVALGNVFGSNIFNMTIIVGVAGLISPLQVSPITLAIGLPFLGLATLLFIIASLDREVKNYEGALFLMLYAAFLGLLISSV